MNYKESQHHSQLTVTPDEAIRLPSYAPGFRQTGGWFTRTAEINTGTRAKPVIVKKKIHRLTGGLSAELNAMFAAENEVCPVCGGHMHAHGSEYVLLKHITLGSDYTELNVCRLRRACSVCTYSVTQRIPFQDGSHRITRAAGAGILHAMKHGGTCKKAAIDCGINRNIVMEVHKSHLAGYYTDCDGVLIKPERQALYLGIDEWKLHDGNHYATIIIDLETGHILWIQDTKKTDAVRNFIAHAGDEFMKKVKGIACDMNADFARAFKKAYDHFEIIYDRFHLIRNFNEKVITPVRIAEQKRLKAEGRHEEAERLRRNRYITTSSRDTLKAKDAQGAEALKAGVTDVRPSGQTLFKSLRSPVPPGDNRLETYEDLIRDNRLLCALDIVREQLRQAYMEPDAGSMKKVLEGIVSVCRETGNEHFKWFAKLVKDHLDGIIAYAVHRVTSGKCEGIVNLIKTVRRAAYGFKDTDYFFLRLLDASRGYPA